MKKHAFQIWDVRLAPPFAPLAPFASIDSLQLEFRQPACFNGRDCRRHAHWHDDTMGQTFRSFMNAETRPPPQQRCPQQPRQRRLQRLHLQNLGSCARSVSSTARHARRPGCRRTSVGFNIETT
jgi:hypothetical protein